MNEYVPATPAKVSRDTEEADDNSSLVLSPAYKDQTNNDPQGQDHLQMTGYGHGLSSRKKPEKSLIDVGLVRDTTPTILSTVNPNDSNASVHIPDFGKNSVSSISDMSLEVGRNENDVNKSGNALLTTGPEVGNALEQIDVNISRHTKNNHSLKPSPALTTDASRPMKHGMEDQKEKSTTNTPKRQRLSTPPKLAQEHTDLNNLEQNTSPMIIEMIDTKVPSSPMVQGQLDLGNNDANPEDVQRDISSPISSNHMLTPIRQRNQSDYEEDEDPDLINLVSKRNEELVDEIHIFNSKINSLTVKYEKLNNKYKSSDKIISNLEDEKKLLLEQQSSFAEEKQTLSKANENMKTRLKEVGDEIKMLNSNQNLLQNKYDKIYSENEKLQQEKEVVERRIEDVELKLKETGETLTILTDEKSELQAKIENFDLEKQTLEQQLEHSKLDVESYKSELEMKTEQLFEAQDQLKKNAESEQNNYTDLEATVKALTEERNALQEKMKKFKEDNNTEIKTLKAQSENFKTTMDELTNELELVKKEKSEIDNQIQLNTEEMVNLRKQLEDSTDECKVRVAEVSELNVEIESLKEDKVHLEEAVARLEQEVSQRKEESNAELDNFQKAAIELESIQLKSSNLEALHLKEIQDLTLKVEELERSLEQSSKKDAHERDIDSIGTQTDATVVENDGRVKELESKISELEEQNEKLKKSNDSPVSATTNNDDSLKAEIESWKTKYEEKEKDTNKRLRLLAEDLYHQYSSKHEQKVRSLKKSYEQKYETQVQKLTVEQRALNEEITRLTAQLKNEREEKRELVRSMENDV